MLANDAVPQALTGTRVLLLEDDLVDAMQVHRMLRRSGAEVVHVANRAAAETLLRQSPNPDAVLTDLQLPDSSGRDTVRALRRIDDAVPILVLSGNVSGPMRGALVDDGAHAVLEKGHFDAVTLAARLREALTTLPELGANLVPRPVRESALRTGAPVHVLRVVVPGGRVLASEVVAHVDALAPHAVVREVDDGVVVLLPATATLEAIALAERLRLLRTRSGAVTVAVMDALGVPAPQWPAGVRADVRTVERDGRVVGRAFSAAGRFGSLSLPADRILLVLDEAVGALVDRRLIADASATLHPAEHVFFALGPAALTRIRDLGRAIAHRPASIEFDARHLDARRRRTWTAAFETARDAGLRVGLSHVTWGPWAAGLVLDYAPNHVVLHPGWVGLADRDGRCDRALARFVDTLEDRGVAVHAPRASTLTERPGVCVRGPASPLRSPEGAGSARLAH